MSIQDWNEAFVVLQRRAEEVRGFIELTPPTAWGHWPRTIGADVIAIAAVVDPSIQRLRSNYGIQRRWNTCLDDIQQYALAAPGETYRENRAFWRCLAAACGHLESAAAPLPDVRAWTLLLAELGRVLHRNGGPGDGPFKHFDNINDYSDLYHAQYMYLRDLRGADAVPGVNQKVPRTTNADVIALAEYWGAQLDDVKEVMGHDGVVKRWKAAVADIDQIARKGDANAVYEKNKEFWPTLLHTMLQVNAADLAPSKWDIVWDSFVGSIKHLPQNVVGGVKVVASEIADIAGDAAHGVGNIASRAGTGLFSGLGTPLLVGGGLLGLFLLARNRNQRTSEEA